MVVWENSDKNLTIFEAKVKSINFFPGEPYQDDKSTMFTSIKQNKEAIRFVSDDEDASED